MLLLHFRTFVGVLVGLCLLATIVELATASVNPDESELVGNVHDIQMNKIESERTPILQDDTQKGDKCQGNVLFPFGAFRYAG